MLCCSSGPCLVAFRGALWLVNLVKAWAASTRHGPSAAWPPSLCWGIKWPRGCLASPSPALTSTCHCTASWLKTLFSVGLFFSGLIQLGSFLAPCLAHGRRGRAGASGSTGLGLKMVLRKLQCGAWAHTHGCFLTFVRFVRFFCPKALIRAAEVAPRGAVLGMLRRAVREGDG